MPFPDFKCQHCGKCCTVLNEGYNYETHDDQIQIWRDNAPHILKWVDEAMGDYWISPSTNDLVDRCPWLRIYKSPRYKNVKGARCLIHKWKPEVCRDYPGSVIHALFSGCGGFNHLSEERLKHLLVIELIQVLRQIVLDDKVNVVSRERMKSIRAELEDKLKDGRLKYSSKCICRLL